jgi:hypothetical protein
MLVGRKKSIRCHLRSNARSNLIGYTFKARLECSREITAKGFGLFLHHAQTECA